MKIVLSTFPSDKDADLFAGRLIENRLAACVNIVRNISSVYVWQDKLCSESENLLVIKTTEEALSALRQEFEISHPYDVFEFVVLNPEEVNQKYSDWVSHFLQGEK